jgi:hypothetical protein
MNTDTVKNIKSSSIRFPSVLWADIKASAQRNMRSTNSEIVIRLKRSLEAEAAEEKTAA